MYYELEGEDKDIILAFQSDYAEIVKQKHCANTMVRINEFDIAMEETFRDFYAFPQPRRLRAYFEKSLDSKNSWTSKEAIFKLNYAIFKLYLFK